jgi:uncharacterized protein
MERLRLSRAAARAVALAAQGLLRRPRRPATKHDVRSAMARMGALQIDTIHVVARSPYLVLWSRLGDYRPEWLDELLAEGELFEYWAHEACFLPAGMYPLFRHRMLRPASLGWKYGAPWMAANRAVVRDVLRAVRERGPLRAADFAGGGTGAWWGWKPEKRALEYLFTAGELMVARRERFQRVYDLPARVRRQVQDETVSASDAERALALDSVRALGVARARWVADYYRLPRRTTPGLVERLAGEGALVTADVEGWSEPLFVHPDHVESAEAAAAGRLRSGVTTLLSPFDPLVWDRARALELFGFDYRLECYTPASRRRWGYFVLPILRRGRLVGRLDAKAHRAHGRFEVKALYLEAGVRADDALARDLAGALAACGEWHGTAEIAIRRTAPASFARTLRAALRNGERGSDRRRPTSG